MRKLTLLRTDGITFEEGCNRYLENCRSRNLRAGTLGHYRQTYTQLFKYFDPNMPVSQFDKAMYDDYVRHLQSILALLLATLIFLTSCTKQANQMEKTDTKTSAITETSLVGSSTEQIIQQTGSNVDDAVPTAPPYSPAFGTE